MVHSYGLEEQFRNFSDVGSGPRNGDRISGTLFNLVFCVKGDINSVVSPRAPLAPSAGGLWSVALTSQPSKLQRAHSPPRTSQM